MEARALMRCLRSGVCVPGIRMVDPWEGVIGLELVEGPSIRSVLAADNEDEDDGEGEASSEGATASDGGLLYLEKNGMDQGTQS